MTDRTLTCRDCGQEFTFTAGEQDFYTSRGFSEPQRCSDCRAARKTQRGPGGSAGAGGFGGGGGSSYGDDAPRAPRQLFAATCSDCGRETEVPFNPTPGKPVYCRDCFSDRKSSSSRYSSY